MDWKYIIKLIVETENKDQLDFSLIEMIKKNGIKQSSIDRLIKNLNKKEKHEEVY